MEQETKIAMAVLAASLAVRGVTSEAEIHKAVTAYKRCLEIIRNIPQSAEEKAADQDEDAALATLDANRPRE